MLQSDGKRGCYFIQKNGKLYLRWELTVEVGIKSLSMLEKFVRIFESKFGRKLKIHRLSSGKYKIGTSVKKLIKIFEELDIDFYGDTIPPWVTKSLESFGAYLAGRVDGDGDIRIKGGKRSAQCVIRISDGNPQTELKSAIERLLKCKALITKRWRRSVHKGRIIEGTWYTLEFLVSRKNIDSIKRYLLPNLTIPHKRLKLENYCNCILHKTSY